MKVRCSISLGQYTSIKEDVFYLENEGDTEILRPGTRRFLKQVFERAEIKLARRQEKNRAFNRALEGAKNE